MNELDQEIINDTVKMFTDNGWLVVSRSDTGIQFRKPAGASLFLIILGIALLPLCIGVFFLFAAFTAKDRVVFVTLEQMRAGQSRDIMTGSLYVPPTPPPL